MGWYVRLATAHAPLVVHACLTLDGALKELPPLFAGESVKASAEVGSNLTRESTRKPKALCFGGGIPEEEQEQVKQAILDYPTDGASKDEIKFTHVPREEMLKVLKGGPPSPEVSGGIAKRELDKIYGNK
jgi:hypothetical protein